MIYVLHGEDEFSLHEALSSMKEDVEPAELRDVNTTTLEGSKVSLEELASTCGTVPFLAEKRMVIVQGLLSLFERAPSRAGGRAAPSRPHDLGRWEQLAEKLAGMPPITELIFVEGRLGERNPLLSRLRPMAKILSFPLPSGNELRQWIRRRAAKHELDIEPRAVDSLAETIGGNLRVIDAELQKLSLYRWGESVGERDVQALVSYVREANVFAAVDALLEGRAGVAIEAIHQLMDSGRPPSYLITMIARQVRLLLLAKELKAKRVPAAQVGERLSLTGYPLRKTLEQEGKLTRKRLVHIHHQLLEADLRMKTGQADERLAMDMLIGELASGSAEG